ncbi:hypothetical protein VOLCADRAFT_97898 [Volvox carteri f. nagariensis]|uniref:Uncharacterized protein n=1 Tax=Volvox carteri f. nagariensis TaxID=3068 RepID=D8UDY0_VOLCA|nr:uncharacterized protein VOLCADRAFT_97898 [Volvox carteri f. nagariensis]EFJ41991.1 hypothetical protein VOLCADRAFT_97898 [Volvox carteri f. nagariensis]|eukprot:XP_002956866.1 hypothetical protein VOLCADRAFT_97898 [Volvox carteri f. nagariensis]
MALSRMPRFAWGCSSRPVAAARYRAPAPVLINATQTTCPRQLCLGASLRESKNLRVLALQINTTQTTCPRQLCLGASLHESKTLLVLALRINATQPTNPKQLSLGASLHESIPPGAGLADKCNTNYRPKAALPGCFTVREQNLLVLALWINTTQTTGPRQLRLGASLSESKTCWCWPCR